MQMWLQLQTTINEMLKKLPIDLGRYEMNRRKVWYVEENEEEEEVWDDEEN